MSGVLEGSEHLERELTPEPIAGPAVGLACAARGAVCGAGALRRCWAGCFITTCGATRARGADAGEPGEQCAPAAEQSAGEQECTDHGEAQPGACAAEPEGTREVDQKAIPILGKQVKPQEKTTPKTQHAPAARRMQDNLARYGEQTGHGDSAGDAAANRIERTDGGGRQRFCEPVWVVCGPDQQQDGE